MNLILSSPLTAKRKNIGNFYKKKVETNKKVFFFSGTLQLITNYLRTPKAMKFCDIGSIEWVCRRNIHSHTQPAPMSKRHYQV